MFGVKARTVVLLVAAASVSAYGYQAKAPRQAKPAAKKTAGKAAPPLTPQQQELFQAGREIYTNVCSVCHQPDGQGGEKLAPSLVRSAFAVGNAEIPIRIVLNGKQGDVGLMPPLAGTLNDEEVAGVLTYIRREWGHTASAVDPAVVKSVRSQTSSRSKPWTNDELQNLKGR